MQNLTLAAAICGGLAFAVASAEADDYSPRVGRPHPDFTLPKITDRTPVCLSQFRGRKVLLIHFASW